jgi:hypothetical protein
VISIPTFGSPRPKDKIIPEMINGQNTKELHFQLKTPDKIEKAMAIVITDSILFSS